MSVYIPLNKNDAACQRLATLLTERGVVVARDTTPDGRVMVSLTNTESGKVGAFHAPLNVWHDTPEATLAFAADLALRWTSAHGDFDLWLRLAGYGIDREYLRGVEMRRARMEEDEAAGIANAFAAALGHKWTTFIEEALG